MQLLAYVCNNMRTHFFKYSFLLLAIFIQNQTFCQTGDTTNLKVANIKVFSILKTPMSYSVTNKDSINIVFQGYGDSAKIISYDVTTSFNGLFQTTTYNGIYFVQRIRQLIHSMSKGSIIGIHNIKYRIAGDKHIRIAQGMTIKVI